VFLGGFVKALGVYFITISIMAGHVGLPPAIVNTCGAFYVILDYLIYGYAPGAIKILGMVITIAGAIWLLTENLICGRIHSKKSDTSEPLLNN
jgi:hypothetical protein